MNPLPLTVRLLSAAAAIAITLMLLDTVVSIAAPQRVVLMARTQHLDTPMSKSMTLALALNDSRESDSRENDR